MNLRQPPLEVVERVAKAKATYLRWGRDTFGWAIYLFRTPPIAGPDPQRR